MILANKIKLTTWATILKLTFGHLNMSIWGHISCTLSKKQFKHILFYERNQFYQVELVNIKNKDSWSENRNRKMKFLPLYIREIWFYLDIFLCPNMKFKCPKSIILAALVPNHTLKCLKREFCLTWKRKKKTLSWISHFR